MTKVKYQFTFKKIAVLTTSQGNIKIGNVEEYFDNNGEVKVTIKFEDEMPKEAIQRLCADPQKISIIGMPVNIHDIEVIEQALIHLPK